MGSAPMIALSPSGCPPPRLPPTPHRHSCESRNPSPPRPHLPLLGTRVRGHDVVPPSFLRSCESRNPSLGRGGWPRPTSPFWVPASAGTTNAPPSFLRSSWKRQESILGAVAPASGRCDVGAVREPPLRKPRLSPVKWWLPAGSLSSWKRGAGIHPWDAGDGPVPPPPSGYPRARARRGSTVIPAKLVLVETGSRNPSPTIAQIPLASRPKSACKSLTRPRPLLYHSVQSFPEQGARPWKTLGAVVPARGCRTISERTYT